MTAFTERLTSTFHPHDPVLVGLSIVLAVIASYVSLELAGRIKASTGRARYAWLIVAAVSMGGGIWSMHFVAMLGVKLPVASRYDIFLTALSFVLAVVVVGYSLYLVFWKDDHDKRFVAAGLVMGLGVAGMHYLGMAALKVPAAISFDIPIVALSVAIAIVASCVALWLAFTLEHFALKIVSAVIMGLAVAGMHFTGMAAFLCIPNGSAVALTSSFAPGRLAIGVAISSIMILFTGFMVAQYDRNVRMARMARAMRQSQEHLERAQRISRTGSIEIDLHTGHTTWSDEVLRAFGFSVGAKSAGLAELFAHIHPENRKALEDAFVMCRAGRRPQPFELHITASDGTERLIYHDADVIFDEEGRPASQLSILRDITELRDAQKRQTELERELLQAQKIEALGTMAGGIAHELNTPIQFITDNTKFLSTAFNDLLEAVAAFRKLAPEAEAAAIAGKCDLEFLETEVPQAITQSLDGLSRVAEIVLAIKRFSHPSSTAMEENNLNDIVKTTATVAKNQWKYVADLDLDLDPALPTVKSNAGELNQVFLNLIVNAAHAIEDKGDKDAKGRITIRTRQNRDSVECSVSDTGVGIKPEIKDKLFDLFFTTKAPGRGTGQGLSLVHTIVTQSHKGKVMVESEPGVGTTFTITLPKAA